jgi:hypothetical protein
MNIDRRHALAVGLLGVAPTLAGSAEDDAVAKNVEAFRMAQIAADAKAFDALCAPELSYSHSDGRVEDKRPSSPPPLTENRSSCRWTNLDPQIRVVNTAAIVRFHWVAESQSVADGKKSNTNLHILMNWQKQGADWKLLSRASTKL